MRDYEVVYIFHPALEEDRIGEKIERFHALLTTPGGEITAVDHWGKRPLAYEIADQTTGHYTVAHFSAPSEALPEFERLIKLDDEVLRYLVVVNEGDLQTTPVPPTPKRDEEADDDGEDE